MSRATPKLYRAGKLTIARETAFALTAGAAAYLKCIGPIDLSGLEQPALMDDHTRIGITQVARIPGPKTGQVVTRHYMHGVSAAVPSGALAATDHPFGDILGFALGAVTAGGYVSQDPATSTTAILKGPDLTSLKVGQALAYSTPTRTGYHVGWGTNNTVGAVDEIPLLQTAPEAASTNPTVVFGSITAGMTSGNDYITPSTKEALRLVYTSHDGGEEYTLKGCFPVNIKWSLARGELPVMEVTWGVASWSYAADVSAPTAGTYSYAEPEYVGGAHISWGTTAADASRLRVNNLEIDLGLSVSAIPNPNFTNTIGGWFVNDRRPTATFTLYRDGGSGYEITDWDAQTARIFTATFGTQPGRFTAFCFPSARVIEYPKRGDEDGSLISTVKLEAHNYTADTADAGSTVEDTDFRVALL